MYTCTTFVPLSLKGCIFPINQLITYQPKIDSHISETLKSYIQNGHPNQWNPRITNPKLMQKLRNRHPNQWNPKITEEIDAWMPKFDVLNWKILPIDVLNWEIDAQICNAPRNCSKILSTLSPEGFHLTTLFMAWTQVHPKGLLQGEVSTPLIRNA